MTTSRFDASLNDLLSEDAGLRDSAFATLRKILSNILEYPQEPRYRTIKLHKLIEPPVKGALRFLSEV